MRMKAIKSNPGEPSRFISSGGLVVFRVYICIETFIKYLLFQRLIYRTVDIGVIKWKTPLKVLANLHVNRPLRHAKGDARKEHGLGWRCLSVDLPAGHLPASLLQTLNMSCHNTDAVCHNITFLGRRLSREMFQTL